jgi:hypothetical protein
VKNIIINKDRKSCGKSRGTENGIVLSKRGLKMKIKFEVKQLSSFSFLFSTKVVV